MAKFEKVESLNYPEINLPVRATTHAAGYDFEAAEDIVIPSYFTLSAMINNADNSPKDLDEMGELTKRLGAKPTLIPTGIKCQLTDDEYLELAARSSMPLKYWLVLANGIGVIDAKREKKNECKMSYMR